MKLGWSVQLVFLIGIHIKDKALLEQLQNFFRHVGYVNLKHGLQIIQLNVQLIKDLEIIIEHFLKYPLIYQGLADFKLFKQAF